MSKILAAPHESLYFIDIYDSIFEGYEQVFSVALNVEAGYITFLTSLDFAL